MSTAARDRILKRIGEAHVSLLPDADPSPDHRAPAPQLYAHLWDQFSKELETNGVSLTTCATINDIPDAVTRLLDDQPKTAASTDRGIRVAPDPRLSRLTWQDPDIHVTFGAWQSGTQTAISHAVCAIASTGSLVLSSSATSPTLLAFLPDHHIIVMHRNSLCATLADGLHRAYQGDGTMQPSPRAVNIISSASRTADIGGEIVFGAHGPLHLSVIAYT